MYKYHHAQLIRVIDGDTIEVEFDFGFSLRKNEILRLADIDTEELRDKDPNKRILALAAKRFVQEKLENAEIVVETLKTKRGKERETFGRYVAVVWYYDEDNNFICLNEELVSEGFAEMVGTAFEETPLNLIDGYNSGSLTDYDSMGWPR